MAVVGPLALPPLTVDLHYHLMRSAYHARPALGGPRDLPKHFEKPATQ
jgi:hypothetical protein